MPFSFNYISLRGMCNEIKKLDTSKAIPKSTIPVKILKDNLGLISNVLHNNFTNSLLSCVFPSKLKMADVSPVYKKGGRTDKGNYRPVSILPAVSKVYERLLFRQINDFIEPKLSHFNVDFVKGTALNIA